MRFLMFPLFVLALLLSVVTSATAKETAFERIQRTQTIRCGYVTYPPYVSKNLETGKFEGIIVDVMNAAGKELGYDIQWTQEVGYADFAEGMKTGRYDMFCQVLAGTPPRSKVAYFTEPLWHEGFYVYTRAGEKKRFQTKADINDPSTTIIGIDGEIFQLLGRKYFPKAKEMSLPNMTAPSDLFMSVATGKADIVFHGHVTYSRYAKNNPSQLVRALNEPIIVLPCSLALPLGDNELQQMMNLTFEQLYRGNIIQDILAKYHLPEDVVFRRYLPYVVPK
ncbi:MAG: substrate-binding periplasmic protein [Bdellovibrionales bacterium]